MRPVFSSKSSPRNSTVNLLHLSVRYLGLLLRIYWKSFRQCAKFYLLTLILLYLIKISSRIIPLWPRVGKPRQPTLYCFSGIKAPSSYFLSLPQTWLNPSNSAGKSLFKGCLQKACTEMLSYNVLRGPLGEILITNVVQLCFMSYAPER